jgi:hypothetical protein
MARGFCIGGKRLLSDYYSHSANAGWPGQRASSWMKSVQLDAGWTPGRKKNPANLAPIPRRK